MRDQAMRRYTRRMIVASILYTAAIIAAATLLHDRSSLSAKAVVLALLPGAGVLMMIHAMARMMMELTDEFIRMLVVRQALVATATTLSVTSVWGLLELYTDVPQVPIFWVFPLWCAGLGVGALFNRATIGSAGCP